MKNKVFSALLACLALMALTLTLMSCDGGTGAVGGNPCRVIFDAGDGGGVPPAVQTVAAGSIIRLPGQEHMVAPVGREELYGWRTGGATYNPATNYEVRGDVHFTAQWRAPTNNPNGDTPGGNPSGGNPSGGNTTSFSGTYYYENDSSSFINFHTDGSCTFHAYGATFFGTYTMSGNTLYITAMDSSFFMTIVNSTTLRDHGGELWKTTPSSPGGNTSPTQTLPSITIVNNTGYTIYYLYVSPTTSSSWGNDMLGTQVLRSGNQISVTLPYQISTVSRYDIKVVDLDGDSYTKMNVSVSANSRIVFTMADFDY